MMVISYLTSWFRPLAKYFKVGGVILFGSALMIYTASVYAKPYFAIPPVFSTTTYEEGRLNRATTNWTAPNNVSNDDVTDWGVEIAADGEGNVHAVWTQSPVADWCGADNPTDCNVYYSWKPAGGSWSTPENISPTNSSGADIAVDASGTAHVIYGYGDAQGYHLYYSSRPNEGTWSSPDDLTGPLYTGLTPEIAVGYDNSLHVIYNGKCESCAGASLLYITKPAGGSWTGPETLSDVVSGYYIDAYPHLAVDACGDIHVTFHRASDTGFYYRMKAGGVWSGFELFTGSDDGAGLIADANCTIYLSFLRYNGSDVQVQYVSKQQGGNWSVETPVTNNNQIRYALRGIDATGSLYWIGDTYPQTDIWIQTSEGDNWSDPINLSLSGTADYPRLVLDGVNQIHVVWWENYIAKASPAGDIEIYYTEGTINRQIFLPIAVRPIPCLANSDEQEPNGPPQSDATGPLCLNQNYFGTPEDDNWDYFYFTLNSPGTFTIDLTDHPLASVNGAQLLLYYQTISSGNLVAGPDVLPPYQLTYTGAAGTYYIVIYNDIEKCNQMDCSQLYTLRVSSE